MRIDRLISVILICGFISIAKSFNANEDIYFELYTQENPDNYQVLRNVHSIENTAFFAERPTRIFVHGYRSFREIIKQYSRTYLSIGNFNFIAMNWINGAETFVYPVARARVNVAASVLAELIEGLIEAGLRSNDLIIVGHSLGAHIAGLAAKKMSQYNKIGSIVGLDPAAVLFNVNETESRLAQTDADYVQIIHTDTDGGRFAIGIDEPLGHGDFYPNFGFLQPGCLQDFKIPIVNVNVEIPSGLRAFGNKLFGCSHGRAHEFFLESLYSIFPSVQCATYSELAHNNKCIVSGVIANMGGDFAVTQSRPTGIFYLETRNESPYAIGDINEFKRADMVLPNNANGWLSRTLERWPRSSGRPNESVRSI